MGCAASTARGLQEADYLHQEERGFYVGEAGLLQELQLQVNTEREARPEEHQELLRHQSASKLRLLEQVQQTDEKMKASVEARRSFLSAMDSFVIPSSSDEEEERDVVGPLGSPDSLSPMSSPESPTRARKAAKARGRRGSFVSQEAMAAIRDRTMQRQIERSRVDSSPESEGSPKDSPPSAIPRRLSISGMAAAAMGGRRLSVSSSPSPPTPGGRRLSISGMAAAAMGGRRLSISGSSSPPTPGGRRLSLSLSPSRAE